MCMGRSRKGVGGMLCERERCSIRLNSHHHRAFAIESSIHVCVYNKALTSNVKTRIQREEAAGHIKIPLSTHP